MKEQNKKSFSKTTKANSSEQVGVRTDLEADHPLDTTDQYAGDSVNEHKAMENANQYIAEEEFKQERENL
ncbi:hypothetical protein [Aquibacillus sediminis]|uniref:hypothetical protein n=1 Tax=Aquibacillus sediminis TaxID=2574734 RepID=UPI0011095EC4|nr:hypothetical protein [Aquibacillus sediminis]